VPRPPRQQAVVEGLESCCPFQSAIDLLSKKHALTILWFLQHQGIARFNDIRRQLAVNPVSLSQRLGELEAAGIVSRKSYPETPPRVEYALTPKGKELVPLIDRLDSWARKHDVPA
jgi:DNA-binding HxlR family transcriptional regulator